MASKGLEETGKEAEKTSESIKAGFQGLYMVAEKKMDQFIKKSKTGFRDITNAVKHPVQTIKNKLAEALEEAGRKLEDTGREVNKTAQDLDDMGDAGKDAGTSIKDAVGSTITRFFAFSAAIELVKAGIEAAKSFGAAIIDAGIAAEQTGAKFEAAFSADSGVKEWSKNYADAIHRSSTEVQGFLVSNKAMYQELGITSQAANDLSRITTSMAYDLGSAFKMDDSEALAVVQDYLKGNTAALAEYGIQIDDTVLKQTAMEMGLGKNISSLNDAAMAQVRMSALMENSTAIQQAAAKKQEGYTNSIKSLKGVWTDFLSSAGEKFAPVFTRLTNTILESWPQIEPALMGMAEMLGNGLGAGIPVITELATTAIPPLVQSLGEAFSAVAPLGGVFLDLATTALPPVINAITPLISTFTSLAQTVLPPASRIISSIATTVIPPLVEVLQSLHKNVIVPLVPLVESIASALLPAVSVGLKAISPILQTISPVLSGISGILSNIVGFAGKIVEWAGGGLVNVLEKIANVFNGGTSAKSAGTQIPHNAAGTENFSGGWTHINERGGEMAYLPSGTKIIPADKSEQIISNNRQQNVSVAAPFNPNINIAVYGNADQNTVSSIRDEVLQVMREVLQEMNEEESIQMAIQLGNA